jgi:hypothetical protein
MQNIIDKFCLGKVTCAKSKLYLTAEKGGLGLINIHDFLTAQQAGWVIKAAKSLRDNWRFDMFHLCYGNIWGASPNNADILLNPICKGMLESFAKTKLLYENVGGNYRYAHVFDNALFTAENGACVQLRDVMDSGGLDNLYTLSKLTYEDFFVGNRFKRCIDIEQSANVCLGYDTYMAIRNVLQLFRNRKARNREISDRDSSFRESLGNVKKPARKLKVLISQTKKNGMNLANQQTVRGFFRIINVHYVGNQYYSKIIELWNSNNISSKLSMFIFKFYNNSLGINTRVSHFGDNVSRNCTFCQISHRAPVDETFTHLFVECPTTATWAHSFKNDFLGGHVLADNESKFKFWFLGQVAGENGINIGRIIAILVFHSCVWENKLKKTTPAYQSFLNLFRDVFSQTICSNKKWKTNVETQNIPLFRILVGG